MRSESSNARWRWFWWVAVGAYTALLAYLSLRPVSSSLLDRTIEGIGRAYLHVPAYAGLAVLVAMVHASPSAARRAVVGFSVATACGWLLELAQIPAPTRFFNVLGLALDVAGATAGVAAFLLGSALRRRRKVSTSRHRRKGRDG